MGEQNIKEERRKRCQQQHHQQRKGGEVGMRKCSQQRGGGLIPPTSESIFPERDGGKRTPRARTRRMASHRDKLNKA